MAAKTMMVGTYFKQVTMMKVIIYEDAPSMCSAQYDLWHLEHGSSKFSLHVG
jgi:hypothetical protein